MSENPLNNMPLEMTVDFISSRSSGKRAFLLAKQISRIPFLRQQRAAYHSLKGTNHYECVLEVAAATDTEEQFENITRLIAERIPGFPMIKTETGKAADKVHIGNGLYASGTYKKITFSLEHANGSPGNPYVSFMVFNGDNVFYYDKRGHSLHAMLAQYEAVQQDKVPRTNAN